MMESAFTKAPAAAAGDKLPAENSPLGACFVCKLTVPASLGFLSMAQSWARELSKIAGLDNQDDLSLELAVEEGFTNAAQHAYPDGRPGPVYLEGSVDGQVLTVAIKDEGVPFDPASVPTQPQSADAFGRMGLTLISHSVDQVRFINHGRSGKEMRLTRHLGKEVKAAPESALASLSPAPPQSYEVREMLPEEALQVARVFWLSYGYSYKNENFYRPESLQHLIGSGKVISFVAVAENGEVVGHAGLLRPDPVPSAEAALLVVSPPHRGRGLMERLSQALITRSKELGLYGIYSNPVTSHPVSQKETIRLGGVPCGLDLAACPPRNFKAIVDDSVAPQRESYLSCFCTLQAPPPARVCAPARHQEMVTRIYEALGRELSFLDPGPPTESGSFSVTFDRSGSKGVIRVVISDPARWPEILRSADDLASIGGAEVVDLDLPLSQPATVELWEKAESVGFFFSGIRPYEAADGDAVRLQRLFVPLDLDRLRIYPKFGRALLDYVAAEKERAGSLSG
jgi:anti-sigma regulatory factor (Ser/Thr protein kinase)/GNAT superfamily N-acetyltransferase